jgi:hypothetical protein
MPPMEIGSAATLNDMRICARKRPTIGSHDARSGWASVGTAAVAVMTGRLRWGRWGLWALGVRRA